MALTTVATVKEYLGLAITTADDKLQRLVDAASAAAEQFLSRKIEQATYTHWLNGTGGSAIVPPAQPVVSVSLLAISGRTVAASADHQAPGYFVLGDMVVVVGERFTRGRGNVQITYTAGYATVPADIEQAIIETVALMFKRPDHIDLSSKSLAGETITYLVADFPPSALKVLGRYQIVAPL